MSMLRSRLFAEWGLLLAAMVALVVVAQDRGWTERLDLQLLDLEARFNPPRIDPSIMLVEIDDCSLAEIGPWPWSRDVHAKLVANLERAQPRAIGIDILFVEPGTPQADAAFADAIGTSGGVVLPHSFAPMPNALSGEVPLLPLARFRENAAALGHVALVPDSDGVSRSFELVRQIDGADYPHFALSVVRQARHGAIELSPDQKAPEIVRFGPRDVVPSIPASEVLGGSAPLEFFEDRIVLVGATAPGLGDRYAVPAYAGGLLSGVEMQAQLASAILTGNLISRAPTWLELVVQLIAIAALFFAFWRMSPRAGLIVALVLLIGLVVWSFALLMIANSWSPVGPALLAIVIAYPLWGWRRLSSVSRFLQAEASALSGIASKPGRASPEGFDIVAQQVARLKRLTGDVSRNLELVQDVINASPDAMLVVDTDKHIVMGNRAAEELFGHIDDNEGQTLTALFEGAGGDLDADHGELTFQNGRVFWLASAPIEPTVGSEVLALREITDLKEAERQRRETLEFLSHDMRSPQVAIIGLAGKSGNALDEEERFSRIDEQARRTLKLTDDFVQIARIASEGVEREEVELNSVIQEAADRAFPLAHRKRIKIECESNEDLGFAHIDHAAIARMLDNLIGNAIKFSAEGSRIELSVDFSQSESFRLIIKDGGPGLPPERVNSPFARFGASNREAGPSAGLGLAYVKQVVDLHKGKIEIDTGPDIGTRFEITLPYS